MRTVLGSRFVGLLREYKKQKAVFTYLDYKLRTADELQVNIVRL